MIKRIYIEQFGGLSGKEMILKDGFNLIYGRNEAGKSTMQAFIKAMLYGLDNGRKMDIRASARRRYLPVGTEYMGGTMEIGRYLIERRFGRTPKEDSGQVIDTVIGERISCDKIGQRIFGIEEDIFSATMFIQQPTIVSGEAVLSKLSNLAQTAQEEVSYHDALGCLEKKRRELEVGKNARIAALETETARLQAQLEEVQNEYRAHRQMQGQVEKLEEEVQALASRQIYLQKALEKAEKVRCYQEYQTLERECSALEREIEGIRNHMVSWQITEEEVTRVRELIEEKEQKKLAWWRLIFVPILVSGGVALLVRGRTWGVVVALILFLVLFSAGLSIQLWGIRKRKQERKLEEDELKEIYSTHGVETCEQLEENYLVQRDRGEDELSFLEQVLLEKRTQKVNIKIDLTEDFSSLADEVFFKEEDIQREIEENKNSMAQKEQTLFQLRVLLSAQASAVPDELESELERKKDELDMARKQLAAVKLAIEAFQKSYQKIQSGVIPLLSKRASQLFSEITQGRYDTLFVDGTFQATATDKIGKSIPVEYLSDGTLDAAYFAMRIAMMELLSGKKLLVMDDAFLQYDDNRAKKAMEFLKKLANEMQILYFTCQSRFGKAQIEF